MRRALSQSPGTPSRSVPITAYSASRLVGTSDMGDSLPNGPGSPAEHVSLNSTGGPDPQGPGLSQTQPLSKSRSYKRFTTPMAAFSSAVSLIKGLLCRCQASLHFLPGQKRCFFCRGWNSLPQWAQVATG